jgi:hypothetical protein
VVEVRLRGSLSARSAIPNPFTQPLSRARCFLRFFLFFPLQQQNSEAVTSLRVEYEFIILLLSSRFLPFLV